MWTRASYKRTRYLPEFHKKTMRLTRTDLLLLASVALALFLLSGCVGADSSQVTVPNAERPREPAPLSMAPERAIHSIGMMITTDYQFHRGEYLRSRFSLAENQPEFVTISEVRWVSWDVLPGKQKNKAGCQFLNLQVRQRDAIAKSIFAKQAELRRAGLL